MSERYDGRDASIASAARAAHKAARSLAREAVSHAERRCFESLADRIQMSTLAARGESSELTDVGPAGNGRSLVEMLLVDDRVDKFQLAKTILRLWFWPMELPSDAVEVPLRTAESSHLHSRAE